MKKMPRFTLKLINVLSWIVFYVEMPLKLPKGTPGMSRQIWAWLDIPRHTQAKVVALHATFFGEYLRTKYQRYQCIASSDIDDQTILQSDWREAFWPETCKNFPT